MLLLFLQLTHAISPNIFQARNSEPQQCVLSHQSQPGSNFYQCWTYMDNACCSSDETYAIKENLEFSLKQLYKECDSCLANISILQCSAMCSPSQSAFRSFNKVRICKSACERIYESCRRTVDSSDVRVDQIYNSAEAFCQFGLGILPYLNIEVTDSNCWDGWGRDQCEYSPDSIERSIINYNSDYDSWENRVRQAQGYLQGHGASHLFEATQEFLKISDLESCDQVTKLAIDGIRDNARRKVTLGAWSTEQGAGYIATLCQKVMAKCWYILEDMGGRQRSVGEILDMILGFFELPFSSDSAGDQELKDILMRISNQAKEPQEVQEDIIKNDDKKETQLKEVSKPEKKVKQVEPIVKKQIKISEPSPQQKLSKQNQTSPLDSSEQDEQESHPTGWCLSHSSCKTYKFLTTVGWIYTLFVIFRFDNISRPDQLNYTLITIAFLGGTSLLAIIISYYFLVQIYVYSMVIGIMTVLVLYFGLPLVFPEKEDEGNDELSEDFKENYQAVGSRPRPRPPL